MWSTDQLIKSEKWVRQKEKKKTPREKQQKSKTMFTSTTVWHYCNVYCVSYRFTLDQKVKTNTLTGPLLLSLRSSGLDYTSSWVTTNPPFSAAVLLNKGAPMQKKLFHSFHGHQCSPGTISAAQTSQERTHSTHWKCARLESILTYKHFWFTPTRCAPRKELMWQTTSSCGT